jgi:hypothetical protein
LRRVKLVLAVAAVMVALLTASQAPAMADSFFGPDFCGNGFVFFTNSCGVTNGVGQESESGTVTINFFVG